MRRGFYTLMLSLCQVITIITIGECRVWRSRNAHGNSFESKGIESGNSTAVVALNSLSPYLPYRNTLVQVI